MNTMDEYFTTIRVKLEETYEDFVYDTILPYCEEVTQLKLNKEELKRILLLGIQKDKELNNDTLDKLRAEIENHCGLAKENHCRYCSYCNSLMGVREILEIIDKYKLVEQDLAYADQDTLMSAT